MYMKILSFILLLTFFCTNVFAMSRRKDPDIFEDLHREIYAHHLAIQKHMDTMFDEHKKYMESMQKKMFKNNASIRITQSSECQYNIVFPDFDKSDIQVSFDDGILSITGHKKNKEKNSEHNANFLYNFSVPHNCEGKPNVKYTKNSAEVIFNATTKDTNVFKNTLDN
jgi:HSP20 family molecular chaperone IbpA